MSIEMEVKRSIWDVQGKGVGEGEAWKKNESSTSQEEITFNEARRGSSQIGALTQEKSEYVWACVWKATLLRGPVLLQGCAEYLSLKWLGQGILEIGWRLGAAGSWA